MTYNDWRDELKNNLLNVSEAERKRVLDYYAEAYADRRAAGFSEHEIIEGFGAPYDAAQAILDEGYDSPRENKREKKRDDYFDEPVSGGYRYSEENKYRRESRHSEPAVRAESGYSDDNKYRRESRPSEPDHGEKKQKSTTSKVLKGVLTGILVFVIILGIGGLATCIGLNVWSCNHAEEYVMHEQTLSGDYDCLQIDAGVADIVVSYDESVTEFTIEYPTSAHLNADVSENGNIVKYKSKARWGFWGLNFSELPKTIIKLPYGKAYDLSVDLSAGQIKADGEYGKVDVDMSAGQFLSDNIVCSTFIFDLSAGSIKMGELISDEFNLDMSAGSANISNVTSAKFDLDMSAGSVNISHLTSDKIDVDLSAGSAKIGVNDLQSEYTISVDKSAGSCNVGNQQGSSLSKSITVDISAGSVTFDFLAYQNK